MTEFDYIVAGGGTAGCIVAARLAEMLEGEYDLDYRSVPQERGNSRLRAEVGEHGQDPAVVGVRRRQAQLAEDVADVLGPGAPGERAPRTRRSGALAGRVIERLSLMIPSAVIMLRSCCVPAAETIVASPGFWYG
jgi:hypothetical protein